MEFVGGSGLRAGGLLAWQPRGETNPHRYVCAALPDGTNQHKVTPLDGRAVDPDVSRLGSEVAYVSATAAPLGSVTEMVRPGLPVLGLIGVRLFPWSLFTKRVFRS